MLPAQSFHFSLFDTRDGLYSSHITSLLQDSRGLLWIGTTVGISIYDGYTFQNLTSSEGLSPGKVNEIVEDSHGIIWVATDKGLSAVSNNEIYRWGKKEGVFPNQLSHLLLDDLGNLWMGTTDGLLMVSREDLLTFHKDNSTPLSFKYFNDDKYKIDVFALEGDRNGNLYVGVLDALLKFHPKTGFHLLASTKAYKSMPTVIVPVKPDSILWALNEGDIFQMVNGRIGTFLENKWDLWEAKKVLLDGESQWILFANDFGSIRDGQIKIHPTPEALNLKYYTTFISDREGNFWLGSREGLVKMSPNIFTCHSDSSYWVEEIYALEEDQNGQLILGANHGQAFTLSERGTFDAFPKKKVVPAGEIMDIHLDKDGRLWFASLWQGISKWENEKLDHIFCQNENAFCPDIFSVITDKSNHLWIGTTEGLLKTHIDAVTQPGFSFQYFHQDLVFRTSVEDKYGTIWLGTDEGLFYVNKDSIQIFQSEMEGTVLSIVDLKIDQKGHLWIATQGSGIIEYKIEDTRSLILKNKFGVKNGLPSDFFLCLEVDHQDNVWAGTYHGLSSIKNRSPGYQITNYSGSDGLAQKAYLHMELFSDNKDRMWVATSMGLYSFEPGKIEENDHLLTTDLMSIHVSGNRLDHKPNQSKMDFPWHQNSFEINFRGINLSNPHKVLYSWRLISENESQDAKWSAPSTTRTVRYSYLPPGSYRFEVKARNPDGFWNENPTSLSFVIKPPYWKTNWFILLCSFLILSLLVGYIKNREKRIRKQESEKNRINQLIAELETRALRAQMNPHFIFNALTAIQEAILTASFQVAYDYLSRFSKLLRMVLENSSKELVRLELEMKMLDLYLSLESMRFDGNFTYSIIAEEDIEDLRLPIMMIQPFVENAIWHGLLPKEGKKMLEIKFEVQDEFLLCSIKDNGIGREKAQAIKSRKRIKNQSMAINLIRDRLQIIQQKFEKETSLSFADLKTASGEACGTLVTLKLPYS